MRPTSLANIAHIIIPTLSDLALSILMTLSVHTNIFNYVQAAMVSTIIAALISFKWSIEDSYTTFLSSFQCGVLLTISPLYEYFSCTILTHALPYFHIILNTHRMLWSILAIINAYSLFKIIMETSGPNMGLYSMVWQAMKDTFWYSNGHSRQIFGDSNGWSNLSLKNTSGTERT